MIPYILMANGINQYHGGILEYQEAKSKLINALYGGGHVSLYMSNREKKNYILLLRIPHRQPENAGSWIIPLREVPDAIIKPYLNGTMTVTEAIKLFEEYHG